MNRRIGAHDDRCVLLVNGTEFAEVIATDGPQFTLLFPTGEEKVGTRQDFNGWVLRPAKKIVKADGTWCYYSESSNPKNPTKTSWFHREHVHE